MKPMKPNADTEPSGDFRAACYTRYVSTHNVPEGDRITEPSAGHRRWQLRKYISWVEHLSPDAPILEIGCGNGEVLKLLASRGMTGATGIDVSAEQVAVALQAGVNVTQQDVFDSLAARKPTYAAIIAIDVLEHFSKEELLTLMSLIHDALLPEGLLLLQTPNGAGLFANQIIFGDLTHMTICTPESLAQLLRMSGFEDLHFTESGPVGGSVRGCIRVGLWRIVSVCATLIKRVESRKTQKIWTENMICCCRKAAYNPR